MSVKAKVERTVGRGVKARQKFTLDKGHARLGMTVTLQVGKAFGKEQRGCAAVLLFGVAQHDAVFFN